MSRYNGTSEPLTAGEVLVELARRTAWGSEAEQAEAVECLQKEFGLWTEPDHSDDPEDVARAREAVRLTEENAKLRAEKLARDRDDELARLRKENEELSAAGAGAGAKSGKSK